MDQERIAVANALGLELRTIREDYVAMYRCGDKDTPYPLLQERLLPDQYGDEVREHKELLDAIIERDGASAQELMHMHLKRRFKLLPDRKE